MNNLKKRYEVRWQGSLVGRYDTMKEAFEVEYQLQQKAREEAAARCKSHNEAKSN